jgi:hypothetical protein
MPDARMKVNFLRVFNEIMTFKFKLIINT